LGILEDNKITEIYDAQLATSTVMQTD